MNVRLTFAQFERELRAIEYGQAAGYGRQRPLTVVVPFGYR